MNKRVFDFCFAFLALVVFGWVIAICWLIAAIETKENGFFAQTRIGQFGRPFKLFKIRTMKASASNSATTVTTAFDARITKSGRYFRKLKLDELPQFWNVLIGQMSVVGPRPDVTGFADELRGDDRAILSVRPGITGPASLAFRNEEEILTKVEDPELYNRKVIWPRKVELNRDYVENHSLFGDCKIVLQTLTGR